MSDLAIFTQNLSKKHHGKIALRNFSLEVQKGEIHGLVGPSASGKTTLLCLLAGISQATEGEGRIFHHPLGSPEARTITGYVPAKPVFYASLTVWEYLMFFGRLSGLSKAETAKRASTLLKEVDLYSFRDKNPGGFTPGMKTKIAIVQSLLAQPRLLLLDEPVTGLDETGRISIIKLIQELSFMFGSTVLLSAAKWSDIESIAGRLSFIRQGQLNFSAETDEIRDFYRHGIFRLQTSDDPQLLNILPRLAYVQQVQQTEDQSIIVLTKEKEQFCRDFPSIIDRVRAQLFFFREEEINQETMLRFLLPDEEGEE